MLLITRKVDPKRDLKNKLVIADGLIEISVQAVHGNSVVLGIEAPKDVSIMRKEKLVAGKTATQAEK